MVVLKGVILDNPYFEKVLWPCKDTFSTISTMVGSVGFESTVFYQFSLSEWVVALKVLILDFFFILDVYGGLERIAFWQFSS